MKSQQRTKLDLLIMYANATKLYCGNTGSQHSAIWKIYSKAEQDIYNVCKILLHDITNICLFVCLFVFPQKGPFLKAISSYNFTSQPSRKPAK